MRRIGRGIMLSAAAFALAAALAKSIMALTGGSLNLNPSSINSGGGQMSGGAFSMTFSMGSGSTQMNGGGYSLTGGVIGVARVARDNLEAAHAFPTAYKPSLGHDRIVFSGLTAKAKIEIFTMAGEKIRTIEKNDALTDQLAWFPVVGEKGGKLASGVYLFVITTPGQSPRRGKLMIIK